MTHQFLPPAAVLDADLAAEAAERRRRGRFDVAPLVAAVAANPAARTRLYGQGRDERLTKAFERGRAAGCLTLGAADLLATHLLGEHLDTIWPDARLPLAVTA
jgi:hypothetical protein